MTRLLCSGDLHLGAGSEYGRKPGDRLRDQQHVWERILDLARERDVDGILFAGDAFEGPIPTSEHYDAFLRPLRERWTDIEGPLPFLAISGNGRHDSAMRATNALQIFDGSGITVSSRPDVYAFGGCAVATLPWVSPARLVAARNGGDRDEMNLDVAAMLVQIAERGKQDCERVAPGSPHVLLAHWSVSGSSLPNGLPVDQLREPVIPLADLEQLDFDAIVLGHIHQEQLLATGPAEPFMPIFYVGSPMPLNFGEARARHGVWILDFYGELGPTVPEFVPIPSPSFLTFDQEAWHFNGKPQVWHGINDGDIVRVRYRATAEQARAIDTAAVRRELLDAGAAAVKIVPEIVRQDRARVAGLDEQVGELEALERWMEQAWIESDLADRMRARLTDYLAVST